jgi:uncharacterized membrane protein YuzA (DUF378 family)
MRIVFDIIVLLSCIFAPWMLVVTLTIIGLISFESWIEGLVGVILLDMLLFGGSIGAHTLYTSIGFCALYYVTIRGKSMLRIV